MKLLVMTEELDKMIEKQEAAVGLSHEAGDEISLALQVGVLEGLNKARAAMTEVDLDEKVEDWACAGHASVHVINMHLSDYLLAHMEGKNNA